MGNWILGLILGVLLVFFGGFKTWGTGYDAHKLIQQCEQTLPRNQHCELVAVPVEKVEE